jgi:hypothetical protein
MTKENETFRIRGDYLKYGDKFQFYGDRAIGQYVERGSSAADNEAMVQFINAVAERLDDLDLQVRGEARQKLAEIEEVQLGPGKAQKRLRMLGLSLRAILEGAAGDALAGALLGLWVPDV